MEPETKTINQNTYSYLGSQTDADIKRIQDIEDIANASIKFNEANKLSSKEKNIYIAIILELLSLSKNFNKNKNSTENENEIETQFKNIMKNIRKKYKINPKYNKLLQAYKEIGTKNNTLENLLIGKKIRSISGVLVITVFTSPYPNGQKFSCKWNCYYCPNEPDQPRSYLLHEPGVHRANQYQFDPIKQFNGRMNDLVSMGHCPDKIEILILGGTWESYPTSYREEFIKNIFYAANTYNEEYKDTQRQPRDIQTEKFINETAKCKIIGITIETRPDTINPTLIQEMRKLGVTRVQMGIQHTDNYILKKINRQATIEDAKNAIKLLKDNCFKIDGHLMLDLPFSSPEKDIHMIDKMLYDPDLQLDQWKIYPCATVPWTVIKKWHDEGKYKPYGADSNKLINVISHAKINIHPWIRINRVIRDIPNIYIQGGNNDTGLRSKLSHINCQCIRCREVKDKNTKPAKINILTYNSSGAKEFFIQFISQPNNTLHGFLRLRIPNKNTQTNIIFKELENAALIRELHVYGKINSNDNTQFGSKGVAQHKGYGKKLIKEAEHIAKIHGFNKIAVISGVGVRKYYQKLGYKLHYNTLSNSNSNSNSTSGEFMIKNLNLHTIICSECNYILVISIISFIFIFIITFM